MYCDFPTYGTVANWGMCYTGIIVALPLFIGWVAAFPVDTPSILSAYP